MALKILQITETLCGMHLGGFGQLFASKMLIVAVCTSDGLLGEPQIAAALAVALGGC